MLWRLLRWLPAVIWMAVIFYWSSQPVLPIDGRAESDQLHLQAHLIAYAVLGLLLALGLGTSRRGLIAAVLLATLYGITDELHQAAVPGRQARVQEVVLNALSSATALLAFMALRLLPLRPSAPRPRGP